MKISPRIVYLLFLLPLIIATAPMESELSFQPLIVKWDNKIKPLKMRLGDVSFSVGSLEKISFPRKKYPGEKLELLVIPEDPQYAPIKVPVKDDMNLIHLDSKQLVKIDRNTIWLWGQTPPSQCGGASSFSFRFLNKPSIFESVSDLFAWKIQKSELPTNPVLFIVPQLGMNTPNSMTSEVFQKASPESLARCRNYHGGQCPFVFNFRKDLAGNRFEVKMSKTQSSKQNMRPCPD